MSTYHWELLVMYHRDVIGCFIWGFFETSWRRTAGTLPLHPHKTSSQHTNKTSWIRITEISWRRSTETLLGISFETYLRRHWDKQRDVVTTSPRRLIAKWVLPKIKIQNPLSRCYTYYSYMHVCKNVCIQKIIEKAVLKNANLNTNDPYFKMRESI